MADTRLLVSKGVASTPSISSSSTALQSNPARSAFSIQNLGTNTLYVLLGSGASTTVFNFALKGGTVNDDGLGGTLIDAEGVVYTGIITVAGTSPRYTVLEIT